jgi:lysozyme
MQFEYDNIWGVDVSTWQDSPQIPGHINFQKMKDAGASFVILKAGQGDWEDPDFKTGWNNSRGILPRHVYWYYDNLYDPKEQANRFWNIIKYDTDGIIVWLDLEDRLLGEFQGWRQWKIFIQEFKRISGFTDDHVGIYTNFYFWTENLSSASSIERAYFLRHPLWLASYPADPLHPPYADILVPLPWTSPIILQTGTPPIGLDLGVESREIDYDQFNGNQEKFNKYFKLTGEPTPMADYMELKSSVATEYRSIREQITYPNPPHIVGTKIGQINVGSIAKALPTDFYVYTADVVINGETLARRNDIWWKVYEANGNPIVGWVAEIHKGFRYLNTRLVTVAPAPTPAHVVEVFVDGVLEYHKELL